MTERIRSPYNNQAINFKLLHHFVVVCEAASLTRASHLLNVCQSNLTLQMSDLERRLGVQLMHRSWKGVELTEAGEVFLPEARGILRHFEKVKALVQKTQLQGRVDLCCASFFSPDFPVVPGAVRMLHRSDSRYEVKLAEMPSSEQPIALENGQIQVAVMLGKLPNIRFKMAKLLESKLMLLASSGHTWTKAVTPVELKHLVGELFWMVDRTVEPVLHHIATRALLKAKVPNSSIRTAGSLKDLVSQVATGSGVALIPDCLSGVGGSGVLSCVPVLEAPSIDVVAAYKSGKGNQGTRELLSCLITASEQMDQAGPAVQADARRRR